MDQYKNQSPYQVFHQVIGLHHCRSRELLEDQGVYPGQPPLLFALDKQDGQSQKQLSEALGIKPATITMMVKRMTKAGLVKRERDKEDQRVSRVYLTHEGKIIREKAAIILKQLEEECFASLSKEESQTLHELLAKMRDNLLEKGSDL